MSAGHAGQGGAGGRSSLMTYPVLQVIHRVAHLVLGVVVQDSVGVSPVKGSLYLRQKSRRHRAQIGLRSSAAGQKTFNYAARSDLMTKYKSGDSSHQLGEEDEREEHRILQGDSKAKHGLGGRRTSNAPPRSRD